MEEASEAADRYRFHMAVQTRQQFRKKGGYQKRLRKSVARLTAMGHNPGLLVVLGRGRRWMGPQGVGNGLEPRKVGGYCLLIRLSPAYCG